MENGAMQSLFRRETSPMANRGTILNIVSWMLLAIVVCTLIARFAMKLSIKTGRRRLGLDDVFIVLAAVFSFGQTVAVSIESMKVLGQHFNRVSSEQLVIYQKAEYVACMLYVANMGCSRISICILIKKILPGAIPRYTAIVFAGFTAIWTVSGILVAAFACTPPHPWNFLRKRQCIDVVAFVNYIAITNIVVEVLLVIIPLVIWNVRISATKTASVSLVFLARLSVVAAVASQLHFFNNADLSDFTYNNWAVVLNQQIAQNLSVISACLPYLHPFIIKVLAGAIEPETISYRCSTPQFLNNYLGRSTPVEYFDAASSRNSHASLTPLTDKSSEPYCRPLATHGLVRSSHHARSSSRFSCNTAKPIFTPSPPETFFNRLIEVPHSQSRPATSTSATDPLAAPRNLRDVGVLPTLDWDSESSKSGGSRRSSPSRNPTAEYVFNRQQVISVPDENQLYDEGDGSKKFVAPVPSPRMLRKPPRAF